MPKIGWFSVSTDDDSDFAGLTPDQIQVRWREWQRQANRKGWRAVILLAVGFWLGMTALVGFQSGDWSGLWIPVRAIGGLWCVATGCTGLGR